MGDYPCRWQAFHVASELATHADDIGVPISEEERDERRRWRVRFSRFALADAKPHLLVEVRGDRTSVSDGATTVDLYEDDLIEGVAARLDESSRLGGAARRMLAAVP